MEVINWGLNLIQSAVNLNLPNIATIGAIILSGYFGATSVGLFSRFLRLSFLFNVIVGIIGGFVGAYLFLSNIYNLIPLETSLINFDNDINLDMLVGLVVGGLAGGFVLKIVLGLIKNLFSKS